MNTQPNQMNGQQLIVLSFDQFTQSMSTLKDSLTKEFQELMGKTVKEELMTLQQTAEFFDVTTVTIQDWRNKGYFPCHRMGGRIYFKKSEVIDALERIDMNY